MRIMKRRWRIRLSDGAGGEHVLTVEVPRGTCGVVHAHVGGLRFTFTPEDLSKLRQLYGEAQAVALWNRGRW